MSLTFCKKCVMDGSASDLTLDENGVCNFCHQAQKELNASNIKDPLLREIKLWEVIDEIMGRKRIGGAEGLVPIKYKQIKQRGKYDCLIGLSGGVDSSTLLHHAVKLGLRPLCFTMDNGNNDPRADENILRMVEQLKVPLYRYVLNINRYQELRAAYLAAGVINVEAVYDNLLAGAVYEMADQYGIKWILSGGNVATESIMPESWSYRSGDLVNMKDIYKKMTGKKLRAEKGSFPLLGTLAFNYYKWVKGIKVFYLLDYL